MSYTKNWGPKRFTPSDMTCTPEVGNPCGEADTVEHMDGALSTCFLAWSHYLRDPKGWWYTEPIPLTTLVNDINATAIKLTGFSCYRLVKWWGTAYNWSSFLVDLDLTRIINRDLGNPDAKITIPFDQSLQGTNIKFGLYQAAQAAAGSTSEQHIWDYNVWGTFETPIPPVARTLTVNVYDVINATVINDATVNLISGPTIIDSAKTVDGVATLHGVDTTYQAQIFARGYTPYPSSHPVNMTTSDASINVPLTYVGGDGFIIPEWIWILIPVAIGSLGLVYILSRRRRKGRENGITVIK